MRLTKTSNSLKFITLGLLIIICQSCNSSKDQKFNSTATISDRKSDSVNLRNLLITAYKWYEKNEAIDHNNLYTEIYGIDTLKLDSAIREMRKTNFFSEEFLTTYKQIGQRTNQMLKQDSTLAMVGLAFPFQEYDTWHGGQGSQANWDDLTIFNLSINTGNASLKWTTTNWDSVDVRCKKENDKWKISYLQYLDLKMY